MDEPVRLWLVERDYDDRNLITLVYATTDGERCVRTEQSAAVMNQQGTSVTAAVDADPTDLDAVDEADRERYAAEATRMAETCDPDEEV